MTTALAYVTESWVALAGRRLTLSKARLLVQRFLSEFRKRGELTDGMYVSIVDVLIREWPLQKDSKVRLAAVAAPLPSYYDPDKWIHIPDDSLASKNRLIQFVVPHIEAGEVLWE